MAFSAWGRQWIVWKAAWEAESGQPPNKAIPKGPAVEFLPEALDIQETPPSPIGHALLWTILIAFAWSGEVTSIWRKLITSAPTGRPAYHAWVLNIGFCHGNR